MGTVVVGIGDGRVSRSPDDVLTTYALGSCVAVLLHDPSTRVGGLLHVMLPDSHIDAGKAQRQPWMYADTGIRELFTRARDMGANRNTTNVWLAGGAEMFDSKGVFNIGKRNLVAVKKLLWQSGLLIRGEDVGGKVSRTVRLHVETGKVWLKVANKDDDSAEGERQWRLMC
jgi:chemotaxis protein CheD